MQSKDKNYRTIDTDSFTNDLTQSSQLFPNDSCSSDQLLFYDTAVLGVLDAECLVKIRTSRFKQQQPWYTCTNDINLARHNRGKLFNRNSCKTKHPDDQQAYVNQINSLPCSYFMKRRGTSSLNFSSADTKTVFQTINSLLNKGAPPPSILEIIKHSVCNFLQRQSCQNKI